MTTRTTQCEGHPAGPGDPMGATVYCDGSCRTAPTSRREAIAAELDRATAITSDNARAAGHDPHPWVRETYMAVTSCRRCGARVALRVNPDLSSDAIGALADAFPCSGGART